MNWIRTGEEPDRARKGLCALTILAIAASATPALSAGTGDPDWPCVQRKVAHLSIGQMWAGPPIDEQVLKSWRSTPEIAVLAPALALRRTSMEEAEALISDFAGSRGQTGDHNLGQLFAGVFTLLERERTQIIAGIGRYAHRQTALAQKVEEMQTALAKAQAVAEPDLDRIEELEDQIAWDARIYKDRAQSLSYVCETPVILERRAFALARAIMQHLD